MRKLNSLIHQYINDNYQISDHLLTYIKSQLQFTPVKKFKFPNYAKLAISGCFVIFLCLIISMSLFNKPVDNNFDDWNNSNNGNKIQTYHYNTNVATISKISYGDIKFLLKGDQPDYGDFTQITVQFKIENGNDIIIIKFIDNDEIYKFDSEFQYLFNDVILIFEEKSQTVLSDDLLRGTNNGIQITIQEETLLYHCWINGKYYEVNEYEVLYKSFPII